MKNLKKLTILHSNDLHGDFMSEQIDDKLIGGAAYLSGYIQKVRKEEKNVLYTISGDMFRGSVIDSEYKGMSTIEIMNMISPDIVTLGNHEVDYGIGHLLFLEKCARFPIINANLYITTSGSRLFKSHMIIEKDGLKIMFIGILTEEVLAQARQERLIGSFVDIHEAAVEVGRICNTYKTEDIDLTILLTHIGIEDDKKLAELLNPNWGIDLIIGGHSHTLLEEPVIVNNIPIVQAETGTDQIGRFDIMINVDNNSVDSYTWKLIPIDAEHCPKDNALYKLINHYADETDKKYSRYITRFAECYTHPERNRESDLGKIFADLFRENFNLDVMFVASGSIREEELGPLILYRDLAQAFPFQDEIFRLMVTGKQLKHMITYLFRKEAFDGSHTEFYQFSSGVRVVVSLSEQKVKELTFEGKEIDDERIFRIGLQGFHFKSMHDFFDISEEEACENAPYRILATNGMDVLDEVMSCKDIIKCPEDARWITVE